MYHIVSYYRSKRIHKQPRNPNRQTKRKDKKESIKSEREDYSRLFSAPTKFFFELASQWTIGSLLSFPFLVYVFFSLAKQKQTYFKFYGQHSKLSVNDTNKKMGTRISLRPKPEIFWLAFFASFTSQHQASLSLEQFFFPF